MLLCEIICSGRPTNSFCMAVLQFSGGISIMPYHIKSKHPAATWTKEEIELILAQSENKSSKVLQFTLFPKCLCKPSKSYQNIPSRFWRKSQWINKVIKIHLVTTVCAKLHGNPSNFIFLPAMSLFFLFFWFRMFGCDAAILNADS